MDPIIQGKDINDILAWEVYPGFTRQVLTIDDDADATEGLEVGQVLEASSSKEIVCATGANANAILLKKVSLADLQGGETKRLCLVRGPALVDVDLITVASNIKTAALAALAVLGIRTVAGPTYQEGANPDAES
jgi:hypothetical protein